jgi:hypothetical protein
LTATNIFGAKILASDRTPAGKVIDIVFDRSGRPTGVIVGLEGDWRTKKEILLPFSKVDWKPGDGGTETGIVGMTLRELQNLPLGSHPLLPLKPPPSPPQ